jgi:hypothetical protein
MGDALRGLKQKQLYERHRTIGGCDRGTNPHTAARFKVPNLSRLNQRTRKLLEENPH